MFRIQFAESAGKELDRIYRRDRKLYHRLLSAIEPLGQNPYLGKKPKGVLGRDYSLRVDSYRIIYTILKEKLLVTVIDLGHRKDIYRLR